MTSPWHDGGVRERGRMARGAVDHFTLLLVLVVGGISLTVWVPTLSRMAWGGTPPAAKRGIERTMRAKGYAVGRPEVKGHPRISGGSLDPKNLRRKAGPLVLEFDDEQPGLAVAKRPFWLLVAADENADSRLSVVPGETLAVMKVITDWVLLAKRQGDTVVYGWARRRDVAILP